MNQSKRRIEQIKAKLNQLDKSISSSTKQSGVNLVDLIDPPNRKTITKQSVSRSSQNIEKSRMVHVDLMSNRFYEDAKAHMQIKQKMDEEVTKGYKKIANKKKLTDNSAQILAERLNTNIAIAILNADQELTKQLKFEQVGKVLTDLRMFSVIFFDEKFEGDLNSRTRSFK